MAKITINGREIEAPDGAPLVEVIKNAGIFISNLCYIDGSPPYAGCRTCLVEIEGMRGLQLSCTAKVTEGMVVRTDTEEAKQGRQAVLSLIMSYHSDRCLTCHRVVKCKPGDTCLRDNTVTHRCLTCSKNYRCELQTTCEMLGMAGFEPWDGDERTWYLTEHPPADLGNPFLEFDPQMCIICTRCVRACDEIRHTGAITLAGRGPRTRIEFGAGGPIHESNCDFCGSCIDVCPTATLMEHPNKWAATQTERWTPTTCLQCAVGCSLFIGSKKGRGVIVRPDPQVNPVSRDQLCVRGRFHYDAIKPQQRLSQPLIRRNGGQYAAAWDEALEFAAASLARIREQYGPQAIACLGSPFASNEENYLLAKIARAITSTNNIDSSVGAVARAAAGSLRAAFGSETLPADMRRIAAAKTLVVVAEDLESSHQVAALRVKDAVVRNGARVVIVSPVWGELCDFAEVWVQPAPGAEAEALVALDAALNGQPSTVPAHLAGPLARAADLLAAAAADESRRPLAIVYALPHLGPTRAGAVTAALANLAITCCREDAANSLLLLPQEANVWGLRDAGATPDLLPGHRSVADEADRRHLERLWGAPLPTAPALAFEQMVDGGRIKAMIVMNDNPIMLAPDRDRVRRALASLEFLAVIDSLPTDTARLAHVVLPDSGPWAKDGTTTSADRRLLPLHQAVTAQGEARQGWQILSDLGLRLAQRFQPGEVRIAYRSSAEIREEMAQVIPLYRRATGDDFEPGEQEAFEGLGPTRAARQAVAAPSPATASLALVATRSLFTSYEGAALHAPDADKLHREDVVCLHPQDANSRGIVDGNVVILRGRQAEMKIRALVTEAVPPGVLWAPLYYDGGAVLSLFEPDEPVASVEIVPA